MGWLKRLFGKDEPDPPVQDLPLAPIRVTPVQPVVAPWSTSGFIYRVGNDLRVQTNSVAEAKLAIKDLKQQKKQVNAMKRQLTQEMTAIRTQTRIQVANSYSTYSRKEKRRKGTNALIPYENRKMELDAAINTLDTLIHGIEEKLLEHERDQLDENQRASSSPVTANPPSISDADIARTARHGLDRYGYDPLDSALLGLSFEQLIALDGSARTKTRKAIERWWSRNASDINGLSKTPPDSVSYGTMLVQEVMTVSDDHIRRWLFWRIMNPDEMEAIPAGPVTRHFMWSLALKREPAASGPELAVGQIAIAEKVAACLRDEYPDSPLPRHLGYERLAISAEKAGNYEKAIASSLDAKRQGWAGDWDKRIERCQQKVEKVR